jgi:hypothetical protein
MKTALIFGLLPFICMLSAGCDRVRDNYVEGRGQAERDIAKGELKIAFVDGAVSNSDMPVAFWEYTDILRRRFSLGWRVYSLPNNPDAAKAWVRGYNEVAGAKVERKVGLQVLKEVLSEAEKIRAATNANH